MKGNLGRQLRLQLIPYPEDEVLDRTHLPSHEVHVQVKVTVVKLLYDIVLDDPAKQFGINDEARIGVRLTFYGNVQFKVMPMPVVIGASSKNLIILLPGPCRVKELMSSVEVFYPSKINHVALKPQS